MKLRLGISDNKVWVYREKWWSVAFAVIACVICVAVALMFLNLSSKQMGFLLFASVFGLVGILMLVRLPNLVKKIIKDDGVILLCVDGSGLTWTRGLGTLSNHFPWESITEIRLSEKLRFVDSDETIYFRHTVLIFLSPIYFLNVSWLDRVKLGISKIRNGRLYVLSKYPSKEHPKLLFAVNKFAPNNFPVEFQQWLRFNTMTDTFETIDNMKY